MRLLGHVLWCLSIYPQILGQTKGIINLHNPGKFPEDSICSSHFRDSQKLIKKQSKIKPKAIILDKFWVIFYGLLPQMRFNLYKSFTGDAKEGNTWHVLRFLTH